MPTWFVDGDGEDIEAIVPRDAAWLTALVRNALRDELSPVHLRLAELSSSLQGRAEADGGGDREPRGKKGSLLLVPCGRPPPELPGMVNSARRPSNGDVDFAANMSLHSIYSSVSPWADEPCRGVSSAGLLNRGTVTNRAGELRRRQSQIGRGTLRVTQAGRDSPVLLTRRATTWMNRLRGQAGVEASAAPGPLGGLGGLGTENSSVLTESLNLSAARQVALRAIQSVRFDIVVLLALVLDNIFIGVQADSIARQEESPPMFALFGWLFCVVFTAELLLRLFALRRQFFKFGEWWNYFDLTVVTLQVAEEMIIAILGRDRDVMTSMRVVRALRLLRILRVLRVIRFVSELKKVVYLIVGSLPSFFWAMVLLALLIYALAIFFTQLVADARTPHGEQWEVLHEFFGSTLVSALTLYQAVSGGVDWQQIATPLVQQVSPFVGVVFVMYSLFAVLVLLNLVTGVFVDGAMRLSRADKEIELLEKAYQLFQKTDADGSGDVTWLEFKNRLSSPEMSKFFEALEISMARADDLFQIIDHSEDGKLSLEELVAGGLMLQGPAKAIDVAALSKWLKASVESMREDIRHLCQRCPE